MLFFIANALSVASASANVFINEIHYDNASTDTGEFFEIAGLAGTDLSAYTVQLINGANNTIYDTVSLSGIIDNESNGYGALGFSRAGIQNGSPDGIALLGPNDSIQFLSYEGVITNFDFGGAIGVVNSTDIGVSEPSSTPVGSSLALVGMGSQFSDFTFAGPSPSSFGSINVGQSFVAAVPEPQTYAMFLAGLGLLGWAKRRQS